MGVSKGGGAGALWQDPRHGWLRMRLEYGLSSGFGAEGLPGAMNPADPVMLGLLLTWAIRGAFYAR